MMKKEFMNNGVKISYVKRGAGRPFILLHGNGEDHSLFDDIAGRLSEEGYEVYTPDSRGHGNSDKVRRLRYEDMADDIIGLINHEGLSGNDRPILFGFSDGGIVGLLIAMRCPDMLKRLIVAGVNLSPDGIILKIRAAMRLAFLFTRSDLLRLMLTQPDIRKERLSSVTVPLIVLHAERDMVKLSHSLSINEAVKDVKLMIVKGETHGSYIKDNTKLYDLLAPLLG
ncbi:MAG: alpha/beta hydrolase [Methanomassiliicoccaceae archaeon]|jgi:pimeloyl-ACP methyl ester carboxylesterase|nr:alpha/beta hydrolase [Methanomassiliicoccaceae archaeon]